MQGHRLVVTTRDRGVLVSEQGDELRELVVEKLLPLDADQASALLRHHALQGAAPPAGVDDELLRSLSHECAGLPLTLELVGSVLRGEPAAQWRTVLAQLQGISADGSRGPMKQAMEQCRWSYHRLSPALQRCFLDMAAYPEDARVPGAELVRLWALHAPLPSADAEVVAEQQVSELARRSLLQRAYGDNFFVHDVLWDIAAEEAAKAQQQLSFMPAAAPRVLSLAPPARVPAALHERVMARLPGREGSLLDLRQCARRMSTSISGMGSVPSAALCQLRMLKLRHSTFEMLPEQLAACSLLRSLDLMGCSSLQCLPETISRLRVLNVLNLSKCEALVALPDEIGDLMQLRTLQLSQCRSLQSLPERIGGLSELRELELRLCGALQSLPDHIGDLVQLQLLGLGRCKALQSLPASIGDLAHLRELHLHDCKKLQSLPERIGVLTQLRVLDLYGCGELQSLPESVGDLIQLQHIDLTGCSALQSVSERVRNLIDALQRSHEYKHVYGQRAAQHLVDDVTDLQASWPWANRFSHPVIFFPLQPLPQALVCRYGVISK